MADRYCVVNQVTKKAKGYQESPPKGAKRENKFLNDRTNALPESANDMGDQLVLTEQVPIRKLLSKKTASRYGRLDVSYEVAFVGYPDSDAEFYKAQEIRKIAGGDELISDFEASIRTVEPPARLQPLTQAPWDQQLPPDSQEQSQVANTAQLSNSPLQPFTQAPFDSAALPSQAGAPGEPQSGKAVSSPQTCSPMGSKGQPAGGSAVCANTPGSRGSGQGAMRSILLRMWPSNSPSKANDPLPPNQRKSIPFYDPYPSMAPLPSRPVTRAPPAQAASQSPAAVQAAPSGVQAGVSSVPIPSASAAVPATHQEIAPAALNFNAFWPVHQTRSDVGPSASKATLPNGGFAPLAFTGAHVPAQVQSRLPDGGSPIATPVGQGALASSRIPIRPPTTMQGSPLPASSPLATPAQQAVAASSAEAEFSSPLPNGAVGTGSPSRNLAIQQGVVAATCAAATPSKSAHEAASPGRPPRHPQSASPSGASQQQSPAKRAMPASMRPGFLYMWQPQRADQAQPSLANGHNSAPASSSAHGGRDASEAGQIAANQGGIDGVAHEAHPLQQTSPARKIPITTQRPSASTPLATGIATEHVTSAPTTFPIATSGVVNANSGGAPHRPAEVSGSGAQAAAPPSTSAQRAAAAHGASPAALQGMPEIHGITKEATPLDSLAPGQAPGAAEWNAYLAWALPRAYAKLRLRPADRITAPVESSRGPSTGAAPATKSVSSVSTSRDTAAAGPADPDGDHVVEREPVLSNGVLQQPSVPSSQQNEDEQEHVTQHAQTSASAGRGSEQQDSPTDSEIADDDNNNDSALPPDVVKRMTRKGWADATIIGARTLEEGLDVHVQWSDGFDAWIYHAKIKEQLFRLPKLVDFYESKTKKRPKEPRQPVKRAPPEPEASSERTGAPKTAQPSKRSRPNSASQSLPEACRAYCSGSGADTGSQRGTPKDPSADEGFVDAVPGTSSEDMAAAGGNVDEQLETAGATRRSLQVAGPQVSSWLQQAILKVQSGTAPTDGNHAPFMQVAKDDKVAGISMLSSKNLPVAQSTVVAKPSVQLPCGGERRSQSPEILVVEDQQPDTRPCKELKWKGLPPEGQLETAQHEERIGRPITRGRHALRKSRRMEVTNES